MAIFKYKVVDKAKKTLTGLVEEASEDLAAEVLHDRGFTIISLKKEAETSFTSKYLAVLNKIKKKDVVIMSRQFSVMISANVTVVQALKILIEQTDNIRLKMMVSEIAYEVDGGSRLSNALAKRPEVFSNFYVSVIKAGETSGRLDESLDYLATEMEKDYDMMGKVQSAMIYPAFVITGLIIVGIIMMMFVIPKLTSIMTESGAELPIATRILLAVSGFLVNFWWIVLLAVVLLVIVIFIFRQTPRGRIFFDTLKLRIPIFGKLFQRIYIVRFTRSLNTLIVGGVPITEGLRITAEIVDNRVFSKLVEETIKEVEDGNSISSVFIESIEIPQMVSQMMSIGEKTGKLDVVLERIAEFYSREISNIITNLMSLMEPIIMVIMGIAVGIMVSAVILPMYNLASTI